MSNWEEVLNKMASMESDIAELEKTNSNLEKAMVELEDYCELHSDKLFQKFQEVTERNSIYLCRRGTK
jgi:hypothetical protein